MNKEGNSGSKNYRGGGGGSSGGYGGNGRGNPSGAPGPRRIGRVSDIACAPGGGWG